MLSKSQARLFFWVGTVLFSGVFLWLTVDTIAQVPDQTHQQNMSAAVVRGKHIFDKNNCMGCHTIMGEGAYYAPELTKTYERRGEAWLKAFLPDPEAMYPNARRMVKYDFSEQDLDDLIAFFKWVGEMDLNGFPADPPLKALAEPAAASAAGAAGANVLAAAPAVYGQLCSACHQLGGTGNAVGPALDGVGQKYDAAWFNTWLADPQAVRPGTAMPRLPLSDADRDALANYLASLK
ncbi:MAG: cytochrome c [Candidatus Sericytochromatia bacterium]|nr:cytochrome c [Candidatus Sericytochromatia bacterium]